MRTLCPYITLHSFLVPHLWLNFTLIVAQNSRFISSLSLSRDVSFSAQNTQHFILYIFPLFLVSKVCSHPEIPVTDILIQNLSQNKQEEMEKVHIIDHCANTASKKDCWYSEKNQPPSGVGEGRDDDGNKGKNK